MSKISSDVVLTSVLDFYCPFCGRRAAVFNDPVPAVSHDMPMCIAFRHADPVEYLRMCRLQMVLDGTLN